MRVNEVREKKVCENRCGVRVRGGTFGCPETRGYTPVWGGILGGVYIGW